MLLCIFILLPLLAVAQPTPPQIAWSYRYFDGDTSLTYADHAVTAAGEVFVCGRANDSQFGGRAFVLKLSSDGERQWLRYYGAGTLDEQLSFGGIDDAGSGSLIVGGTLADYSAPTSQLYATAINAVTGDVLWSFASEELLCSNGQAIAANDGGAYVAGLILASATGEERLHAARVSPGGEPLWEETFGEMTASLPFFLRRYQDGMVVLGSVLHQRPTPRLVAHLIDLTGAEIFGVEYDDEAEVAVGLRVFNDGLLGYLVNDGSDFPPELYLNEFIVADEMGRIDLAFRLPLKTYSTDGTVNDLYEFTSYTLIDETSIVVSGGKYIPDPNVLSIQPMIVQFDLTTGDTVWIEPYGDTLRGVVPYLPSIENAPDHGLVMASARQDTAFHVGIEVTRTVGETSTVPTSSPWSADLAKVFPNPFNAEAQIQFSLLRAAEVNVKLFDITGREVRAIASGRLTAGIHRLVVSGDGLASGAYLVSVTVDGIRQSQRAILLR